MSGSSISWAICKSAPRSRQRQSHHHTTTLFFTGRMPFLPPNQQRQSTEVSQKCVHPDTCTYTQMDEQSKNTITQAHLLDGQMHKTDTVRKNVNCKSLCSQTRKMWLTTVRPVKIAVCWTRVGGRCSYVMCYFCAWFRWVYVSHLDAQTQAIDLPTRTVNIVSLIILCQENNYC